MGNPASKEVADKYEPCDIPLGQGSYGYVIQYRQKETGINIDCVSLSVGRTVVVLLLILINSHPDNHPATQHWDLC